MENVKPRGGTRCWRKLGLALLIVAGCAFGLWSARRRWFPSTLEQASAAYERGDWPSAIRLGRDVLREWPEDPDASRLVARSSARLGRDDAAIAAYRKLGEAALQPIDHLTLGLSLGRKGMLDEAKGAWAKGLDAGPGAAPLLEELGWLLFGRHRHEDAMQVAHALGRLPGRQSRAGLLLGSVGSALNDIPASVEAFRRAVEQDPGEIDRSSNPAGLRRLMARVFLKADRADLALQVLAPIAGAVGDQETPWLLSRAYLRTGNVATAREVLARAGSYRVDHPLENDPGPYVGEARCEECHARIYRDSLASRHTQSYYRGDQLLSLPRPDRPLADPDSPEVTHSIEEHDGILRERTKVGDKVYDAVIDYAFGTSDRYLTAVNRDDRGDYRISRMSYYQTPEGRGWDRSALDSIHPTGGDQYRGEPVGVRNGVIKCLYCHVTNPRSGEDRVGPETADRAIGCERCHGPGGNHLLAVDAVKAGFPDLAIVNPGAASPADVTVKQCNDCHILDRSFVDSDMKDPSWIRSQGAGWTRSRCNTESGGAFGCVTCHDPHKPAGESTTVHYEAKCVSCHAAADSGAAGRGREDAGPKPSICPVNPAKGCVGCHMPKTRIDSLHAELSDHYIRARRDSPAGSLDKSSPPR